MSKVQLDEMIKRCFKLCVHEPGAQLNKADKACVVNCGEKWLSSQRVMIGALENSVNSKK
jgi:hypothetical protein